MRGIHTKLFVFVALLAASCILYAFYPATTSASISHLINFQGKLTNPDGTNVTDGNYSITFSIYSVSSAGSAIWSETQGTVSVSAGIFQVTLGSVTALPGSVDFNTSSLYLGVKVGSDPEMTPRVQFTAVPYAFNADALGGVAAAGYGTLAGVQTWAATNTFSGGLNVTGLETQTYGSGVNASASTRTITNSNVSSTASTVNGINLALIGTGNGTLNANTLNAINFANVTAASNNSFNGLYFGTGYSALLNYNGTPIINGSGVLQSAGLSGTYSNALVLNSTSNAYTGASLALGSATAAAYTIDVRNTTGTGVHLSSDGTDTGAYLTPNSTNGFYLSGGAAYNGTSWIAKATTGSDVDTATGQFHFFSNTGLTVGGTYTPTLRFQVDATGNISATGTLTGLTGLTVASGGASISGGLNNNSGGITNTGSIAGATNIGLNGTISGGTSYSGSSNITTSAGNINAAAGTLQTSNTDRIDSSGNHVNVGNITGTGAVTLSSTGGANNLTFTSGSNTINLNATTVKTTAGLTYDLTNVANDTFTITNSDGTHTAGLSVEGAGTFGTGVTVSAGGITVTGNSTITGTLGGLTGLTVASGGASIAGTTSVSGGNFTISQTGTGAALIVNRTDGVVSSLKSGLAKSSFVFDSSGTFGIAFDTRSNIISGTGSGTDAITILGSGNVGVSNTSPAATFSIGTGDLFQVAGASGNFQTSGTGLVKTTSATAFQVQNGTGTALLQADTSAVKVTITGAAQVTGKLQVGSIEVGSSATAGDILITDASGNLSFAHPAISSVYNTTTLTSGNNIIWTGQVTTNGGATTVCLTTNGVCTGTAIFPTNIYAITVTGVGGTTAINAPMGTVQSISADRRTLVITLQIGQNLGLGGNTLAYAANGTKAYIQIIGN